MPEVRVEAAAEQASLEPVTLRRQVQDGLEDRLLGSVGAPGLAPEQIARSPTR